MVNKRNNKIPKYPGRALNILYRHAVCPAPPPPLTNLLVPAHHFPPVTPISPVPFYSLSSENQTVFVQYI